MMKSDMIGEFRMLLQRIKESSNSVIVILFSVSVVTLCLPIIIDFLASILAFEIAAILTSLVILFSIFLVVWMGISRYKFTIVKIPNILFLLNFMFYSTFINIVNVLFDIGEVDTRWVFVSIGLPIIYIAFYNFGSIVKNKEKVLLALLVISTLLIVIMTFTDANGIFPSLNGIIRSRVAAYYFGRETGPVTLGTLSTISFISTLSLFLFIRGSSRYILGICLMIQLIGLIFSGGRVAWASTIIGIFVLLILSFRLRKNKRNIIFLIVGLFLVLFSVIIIVNSVDKTHIFTRVDYFVNLFTGKQNIVDKSLGTRISLWQYSLDIFLESPLGVGFSYFKTNNELSPHNDYLNILLGAGLPGFIFYYLFLLFTAIRLLTLITKRIKPSNLHILIPAFLAVLMSLMLSITESLSISNTFTASIIWGIIGLGSNVHAEKTGSLND